MTEYLDALDWKTGRKTGEIVKRKEAHLKGIAHAAIHIWVVAKWENIKYLLFQRRSVLKKNFPGIFAVTVGGHVKAGESLEDVLRETEEEIGLSVTLDQLEFVATSPFTLFLEDYLDYEWIDEYYLTNSQKLSDYSFPDGEAEGIAALTLDDLENLNESPDNLIQVPYFDGNQESFIELKRENFVPDYFNEVWFERARSILKQD